MPESYVILAGSLYELRQNRFRHLPNGHPWDVCTIARSIEEMKEMLEFMRWTGGVEFPDGTIWDIAQGE